MRHKIVLCPSVCNAHATPAPPNSETMFTEDFWSKTNVLKYQNHSIFLQCGLPLKGYFLTLYVHNI